MNFHLVTGLLHVTIFDTFAVSSTTEELITQFTKQALTGTSISVIASHIEYFGPDKNTPVVILNMSQELSDLHYAVLHLLKQVGLVLNDPQYAETGFRAHSTIQLMLVSKLAKARTYITLRWLTCFQNKILTNVKF